MRKEAYTKVPACMFYAWKEKNKYCLRVWNTVGKYDLDILKKLCYTFKVPFNFNKARPKKIINKKWGKRSHLFCYTPTLKANCFKGRAK